MKKLNGIRIKCDRCRTVADMHVLDGQAFDPVGWVKKGSGTVCTECARSLDLELHPEVQKAAEKVVHSIQALMATELSAQPPPGGQALVQGGDHMARRMKRCELMAKYADVVMTIYGNTVGFRLAETGAFGFTSLIDVARNCEDLMKAEIAFSAARANTKPFKPTSTLSGTYSKVSYSISGYDDDYEPQISGPLYRLSEISKVAHKLAQLAATRVGEVVTSTEDRVLDGAIQGIGGGNPWGTPLHGTDTTSLYRQAMMILQKFLEDESARKDKREQKDKPDPIVELEQLLEIKEKFEKAGRIDAAKAVEIKINLLESQIKMETEQTVVDSALAMEASAKDVTPSNQKFDGPLTEPPSPDEIEFLRKSIGDEAVKSGFPKEYEKAITGELA